MRVFHVSETRIAYTNILNVDGNYTDKMNKEYTWMAKTYDLFMSVFPLWKKWIVSVIPYLDGTAVLEISFGNGYLMTQYGSKREYRITGVDYNEEMIKVANRKIARKGIKAKLIQGNVEHLPFEDNTFDTVVNTMAITGYPDGDKALSEMRRVLRANGKLLIVDFDYPSDRNIYGYFLVRLVEKFGDIIKDINALLKNHGFSYRNYPVGGFGSVHLFVCTKDGEQ